MDSRHKFTRRNDTAGVRTVLQRIIAHIFSPSLTSLACTMDNRHARELMTILTKPVQKFRRWPEYQRPAIPQVKK